MGNLIEASSNVDYEDKDDNPVIGYGPDEIEVLTQQYQKICDEYGFLDKDKMAESAGDMDKLVSQKIFNYFDLDQDGKVTFYDFLCGMSALNSCSLEKKAEIIWKFFDANVKDQVIKKGDGLQTLVKTCMNIVEQTKGGEPPEEDEIIEQTELYSNMYDKDKNDIGSNKEGLNMREWKIMFLNEMLILKTLFIFGLISKHGGGQEMPEWDEDLEEEIEKAHEVIHPRIERIKQGIEVKFQEETIDDEQGADQEPEWKSMIQEMKPDNWESNPLDGNPPNAGLKLDYVYGFRCNDTRNNLLMSPQGEVVYSQASLCIKLNITKNTQQFYTEHTDDITHMVIHWKTGLVASGQTGSDALVCIWDVKSLETEACISGLLQNGISNVAFNDNGTLIAAAGLDDYHSIAIFEIEKVKQARLDSDNDPKAGVLAYGPNSRSPCWDLMFSDDDEYIICGMQMEIGFFSYKNGMLNKTKGIWRHDTNPMSCLCLGQLGDTVISGTFRGRLIGWKENKQVLKAKAHGKPVTAIHVSMTKNGIWTAGHDGEIKFWTLKEGKLVQDESDGKEIKLEDFEDELDIQNKKISAIFEDEKNNLIIGTRGSEIIQLLPANKRKVLVRGHFEGELRGLVCHPKEQIFYTVGQDRMVAAWNIATRTYKSNTEIEKPANCIDITPNGEYLAIGTSFGEIIIFKAKDFNQSDKNPRSHTQINESQEPITCLKFTPKGDLLIVNYEDSDSIYIYPVEQFKQKNGEIQSIKKIKKDTSAEKFYNIVNMDISDDQQYIRINTLDPGNEKEEPPIPSKMNLEIYDLSTLQQITDLKSLVNIKWTTNNCTISFDTQGIWPAISEGSDVNCCDLANKAQILVTGDDFSKVKLFNYPCNQPYAAYMRYSGHSDNVTCVRFTHDEKYVITLGGREKSIMQWKFHFDQQGKDLQQKLMKDVKIQQSIFDKQEIFEEKPDTTKKAEYMKEVIKMKPTWYKASQNKDNQQTPGEIKLEQIHGFLCSLAEGVDECRNTCKVINDGKIVIYPTATNVIIYDKEDKTQRFFDKHVQEIISIAKHPFQNYIATGSKCFHFDTNKSTEIYVWKVDTLEVLSFFNNFHQNAVLCMEFNPSGDKLLTAGYDYDNSIVIYDWMSERILSISKVDRTRITGLCWKDDQSFATVGINFVKFWELNGSNLQQRYGKFLDNKLLHNYSCVKLPQGKLLTGSDNGILTMWNWQEFNDQFDAKAEEQVTAHNGKKIECLLVQGVKLYTAGLDGKVILWDTQGNKLNQLKIIVDMKAKTLYDPGVTSISISGQVLAVGTISSELYVGEITGQSLSLVVIGHFKGGIYGAAISPSKDSHKYVTTGGDKTIRLWDIEENKMILGTKPLRQEIRAIDWSPDGKFLVGGDLDGNIYTYSSEDLKQVDEKPSYFANLKDKKQKWIGDIKISKNNKYVAISAHNIGKESLIDIWEIDETYKFKTNFQLKQNFSSSVLNLDFSEDNKYVIGSSTSHELKVYDLDKKTNIDLAQAKGFKWFNWNLFLGWPVQGIFEDGGLESIGSVCRSFNLKQIEEDKKNEEEKDEQKKIGYNEYERYVLATGDNRGCINLFRWPVVVENQVNKTFTGHGNTVTRVKISQDDKYMISAGGLDQTVFVWKTNFNSMKYPKQKIDIGKKKKPKIGEEQAQQEVLDPSVIFEEENLDMGDEAGACKPWLGAIKPPTDYTPPKDGHKKPKIKPKLEYVFGLRSKDTRNNVRYLKSGKIVYHTAALGIVLDPVKNTQTFFDQHTDDITAMACSSDGVYIATGEVGPKPWIFVWNAEDKKVKYKCNQPLQKGISCLAFSPSGKLLSAISINQGDQFPYAIFNVDQGSMITSEKSGADFILELSWSDEKTFASAGPKHFYIWTVEGNKANKKRVGWGSSKASQELCTVTAFGNDFVAGGGQGWVLVAKGGQLDGNTKQVHKGGVVESVSQCNGFLLTGGQDGKVNVFNNKYEILVTLTTRIEPTFGKQKEEQKQGDLLCQLNNKFAKSIRSITLSADNKKILIGTYGCEIHELSNTSGTIDKSTKFGSDTILMTGHYTPCQKWLNEIWGLDIIKSNSDEFVSCGDDGTLRCYSLKKKQQIKIIETTQNKKKGVEKPDKATGDPHESTRGRCVGVCKKGQYYAVGMKEGTLKVYKLTKDKKGFEQYKYIKLSKRWVSDVQFDPTNKKMAFGCHDQAIYLYTIGKKWKPLGKRPLKKHSSYITHFDFSEDSLALHSTCGAYDLLFWDLNKGAYKQNPRGASMLKDEPWATWTIPLGWPVQGIWPECSDGTDINAVCRSNDKKYIATADDFSTLKIFKYPCLKKGAEYTEGKGHSSHVTNVKWSNDDKYIFTSGGEDQSIIIWKVV